MNKNAAREISAVQSAVDAMAVVTLSPEKYAAEVYQPFKEKLASAIDSVRAIDYDITTTAGMASAVKCRALFRDMRVAADKERKARKEPITKIGKLLESGFDQFEERATPLEEMFDADIKAEEGRKEAEKAAKIKAERERVDGIQKLIASLRDYPRIIMARDPAVPSEALKAAIDDFDGRVPHADDYAEFVPEAAATIAESLATMRVMMAKELEREQAAAAAEQSRLAEIARIAAEREELAQLRAAAAETARLAKIENDRIASEQAAESQRLAALQAAQEAAAAALAEQAAASLRAEREAQEKAAADAQAVLAAEAQRLANERQAFEDEKAAVAAAAQKEIDHGWALAENRHIYACRDIQRASLQAEPEEDRATDILIQREDDLLIDVEKNATNEVLAAFTDAAIDEGGDQIVDYEAIAWAYKKLIAFGVGNTGMENAMMLDRLNLMLLPASEAA